MEERLGVIVLKMARRRTTGVCLQWHARLGQKLPSKVFRPPRPPDPIKKPMILENHF
jgi:hypothetical protein